MKHVLKSRSETSECESEPFWAWLTPLKSFCPWSLLVITKMKHAVFSVSETCCLLMLSRDLASWAKESLPFGKVNILFPFSSGDDSLSGWTDCCGCLAGSLRELWGHVDKPSSSSLWASICSYSFIRWSSRLVMVTRWSFVCLNRDTFWTIKNSWVAVYTLSPNFTTVLAHWPRRNRAEGLLFVFMLFLCCPDQTIPHHPCFCQESLCT